MKKLFRTLLPAGLLAAAAVAIHAQSDSRAVTGVAADPAAHLAAKPGRGYVAPRAKTGRTVALQSPVAAKGGLSFRDNRTNAPLKEYMEYVPDIKGMVFAPPSTTLHTIMTDGAPEPETAVSLSASMCTPGGGYGTDDTYYVTLQYSYPARTYITRLHTIPRPGRCGSARPGCCRRDSCRPTLHTIPPTDWSTDASPMTQPTAMNSERSISPKANAR